MPWGIEFEYLLVDRDGPEPGRIRDFSNLDYAWISRVLEQKPGRDDPSLATGDLGIKAGYWYLEGDERFHPDGRFRTLEVKGVEIRTPPAADIPGAVARLLEIEARLEQVLEEAGLGLGIAGFNPVRPTYAFTPPLNPWEQALRQRHRSYDGAQVSTLSYGPDINLSLPGQDPRQNLDAARKLNYYAPWLVPFSFSSPFQAGQPWPGCSRRTYLRCQWRPAVKLFLADAELAALGECSSLTAPARIPGEQGRIEFKAFDAMPGSPLLAACCHLLEGVLLAPNLPGRSETPDQARYQQAALQGFADPAVAAGARELLQKATAALLARDQPEGAAALAPLARLLEQGRCPGDALLERWRHTGLMYSPGGHRRADQEIPCHV